MTELLTDEQLIRAYTEGDDAQALESLIERYLSPVYNFVYRYVGSAEDAEDITQETFVSVWRHIKKYDPERRFKTWIFTIAKNASLNWIKKKRPALFSDFTSRGEEGEDGEGSFEDTLRDPELLPDERASWGDAARRLSAALEQLNPPARAVLTLRYQEDLTFEEIAETLGEPLHTVKSRHRRALFALRRLLSAEDAPNDPRLL